MLTPITSYELTNPRDRVEAARIVVLKYATQLHVLYKNAKDVHTIFFDSPTKAKAHFSRFIIMIANHGKNIWKEVPTPQKGK